MKTVFPKETHVFVEPGPDVWARLEPAAPFDALGGFSLGTLLLLEDPVRTARLAAKIGLMAPIFAFAREAALGGKIAHAQTRYLAKWLRRDRVAALADFYQRAGLNIAADLSDGILSATLEWGLDRLERGATKPPAPSGWKLFSGTEDALLDGGHLARLDPAVRLVAGATHHPQMLLCAWAEELTG